MKQNPRHPYPKCLPARCRSGNPRLSTVDSIIFPAYGVGVIGYAIDGPLAAAFGPAAIFGVGAVYGLLSSAVVLTLRSVRGVTWADSEQDEPRAGRA